MTNLSYYELLSIDKNADKVAIKKAYRKMAMKYHPDKNPNDSKAENNFKLINEAYQVLSDDNKRSIYDRYGKEGLEQTGSSQSRGGFEDLSSVFEEMFGGSFGGSKRSNREKKQYKYDLDTELNLTIDFNEAIFGCKKDIEYEYKTSCNKCKGTGAKNGKLATCRTCDGRGQVHIQQSFMTFAQTCPNCHGSGQSVADSCDDCSGSGYSLKSEKFKVDIPEGINNDNRMRVGSKGNISPNGNRGDLYVNIKVNEDKHFIRHENDIYLEVPIFFTQIVQGATITIPSLKDKLELKVPSNSKDKQHFTFKGEGVKNVNGYGKGNLIVQINIKYPKSINKEQKELINKLQNSFGIESTPYEDNFSTMFKKVKNWFS